MLIQGSIIARLLRQSLARPLLLGLVLGASPSWGCEGSGLQRAIEECKQSGAALNGSLDNDASCGCDGNPCDAGSKCFHGTCCNPLEHASDPTACGCAAACAEGELCKDSACCNPATASSTTNCGCQGPCGDNEACVLRDGAYACECDPELHTTNDLKCGCGKACANTEACQPLSEEEKAKEQTGAVAACRCNPSDPDAKSNPNNCGCRGKLPDDAVCVDGIPQCVDADEVWCNKQCIPKSECLCVPEEHIYDDANCGCEAPCGPGDRCVPCSEGEGCVAKCECDPEKHFADDDNCGCAEACDIAAGFSCQNKKCECDPGNYDNPNNCNCSAQCDAGSGEGCINKICQCADPDNPKNCGCTGIACNVAAGEACINQVCQCANPNDPKNCGCTGVPCADNEKCVNNVCYCAEPNDPNDCGCSGGPCQGDLSCEVGACKCPDNTYACKPVPNLAQGVKTSTSACQPLGNGQPGSVPFVYCGDCVTQCAKGQKCQPNWVGEQIGGYTCVVDGQLGGGGGF